MIQDAWLLFTRKKLYNATAIFESKTPLLLLWRRQESFGKVQACREISSDVKMSPCEKRGCNRQLLSGFLRTNGSMKADASHNFVPFSLLVLQLMAKV